MAEYNNRYLVPVVTKVDIVLAFPADDPLLAPVLPPEVAGFAVRGEGECATRGMDALRPGERILLGRVCGIRRWQFTAGRHCGRRALVALGRAPGEILAGSHGEPRWPVGVRGSITHCRGYAAAIATTALGSVGIDVEPHRPISPRVLTRIASPDERHWITEARGLGVHFDRLLFSVKESIYKAWFPLTSRRLGFTHVRVNFQPADRRWRARLLVPGYTAQGEVILGFEGRYAVDDGFVLAFAAAKTTCGTTREMRDSVLANKPTSGSEHLGGCGE